LSQLELKDVEDVKNTIKQDVQKELDRISREEEEKKLHEEVSSEVNTTIKETETVDAPVQDNTFDDLPFDDIKTEEEHSFSELYSVVGTMDEHNKLVKFMEDNNIKY